MDLDSLLRRAVELGASDVHLKLGQPPVVRRDGRLDRMEGWEPLDTAALETALATVGASAPARLAAFHDTGDLDTAYQSGDLPPGVRRLADEHRGLILVTGATGSGKTTTLAAVIGHVNATRSQHVVTIEDPIEILHPDEGCIVNQREVGLDTESFQQALRRALRQDPDVILIGELRDAETAQTALQAAESGHLVF